ncbi:MAG TPA: DUF885 domain-containing protein [Candidatus Limnocylindrales bacterium]|nr:DUF885 domain-containing protein [Candidatus Limnocylindrales bacterium]
MSKFTEFCSRYFKQFFELHPTDAIYYGIDGYDHLLNDYSDKSYQAEKLFVKESLRKLREIAPADLDNDEAIDHALLEGRLVIQSYEHAKEDYRLRQPDTYSPTEAIYILTVRATKDFAGNLLSRLNRTPALVEQGITNLGRPAANPPKLWTENAIEGAKGGIAFLDSLPEHPKVRSELKDTAALHRAIAKAKTAVHDFGDFLERHLLPRSNASYAVGEEHFNLLLKKKHFLDHDAQSLLALGEALFARTKQELEALADELAPGQGVEAAARAIQENHPSSEQILSVYEKAMGAARAFVRRKQLVTFPAKEELHVVHTPVFRRHEIPFAAYLSPSPKDPNQVGYYYVTPVTSDDLLREHNYVGLENTSVHESYPGHHLQFSIANCTPAAATLPRLMNESSVFYEGWALYCEQLMQEQGFLNSQQHRFVMLKDRLWRALRIIIDVKTQTGKLSYDEAADLMVRELHFPREQACGDLNWYSQSPSVPMGYALGWSIINRLREQEQKRLGDKFTLCGFHDKLLSAGSIALPLVEKRYFMN